MNLLGIVQKGIIIASCYKILSLSVCPNLRDEFWSVFIEPLENGQPILGLPKGSDADTACTCLTSSFPASYGDLFISCDRRYDQGIQHVPMKVDDQDPIQLRVPQNVF